MSAKAQDAVWEFSETTGNERVVLLRLTDRADERGICEERIEDLAAASGIGRRGVQKILRRIEALGELVTVDAEDGGRGHASVRWIKLPGLAGKGEPADRVKGERRDRKGEPADARKTRSSALGVGVGSKSDVPPDEAREEGDLELTPAAQTVLDTRAKVDRRRVTAFEAEKAAAALDEFNKQSERDLVLTTHEWLRMIVMRIRSRPDMTPEQHRHLVQSAFRFKWWERQGHRRGPRVSPSVIYGSDRCFENVLQDAIDEAKGKPVDADRAGKYAVIENRDV